jgi:hypothetical protein
MPARPVHRGAAQERKASFLDRRPPRDQLSTSCARLSFTRGRTAPDALRASLGSAHRDAFDLADVALVARNVPKDELPARDGGAELHWVLKASRSIRIRGRRSSRCPAAYAFRFDGCAAAATAYRERCRARGVVKAIAIAELEARKECRGARRAFFGISTSALSVTTSRCFPTIWSASAGAFRCSGECRHDGHAVGRAAGQGAVEATDCSRRPGRGRALRVDVRSAPRQHGDCLGGVYVVQTTSSNLYALRERLAKAFAHRGAGFQRTRVPAPSSCRPT